MRRSAAAPAEGKLRSDRLVVACLT
jgi:hypothetical protein